MMFREIPFKQFVAMNIFVTDLWISSADGETEDHSKISRIAVDETEHPCVNFEKFTPANGAFISESGTFIVQTAVGIFCDGRFLGVDSREERHAATPTMPIAAITEVMFPEIGRVDKHSHAVGKEERSFWSNDRW